ncbi:Y-family DNA polymerase [Acinetobacter faecalis]|uniref:Y-family DNA polymerase n=1 Tax=Acinetobacter faecalis TaxID=2665161 RepID=UPI00387E393F
MCEPLFKIKDIIEQHNVKVLSSNYKLYAEISKRFHSVLADFVRPTNQEIYSVNKCFLNLSAYISLHNLTD